MSKCADSKTLLKKKAKKDHWPGILPRGGGLGQWDKERVG